MKKCLAISLAFGLFLVTGTSSWAQDCVTIQEGGLLASNGDPLTTGYDQYGYNYVANMYNGRYCDYQRPGEPPPECDIELMMKWNDAWLSNKDCDGDALLDRHFGYDSYIGSGAWLTNHQAGRAEVNGKARKWTYFVKIVAAPTDAYVDGDFWVTAGGIEIGPVIWGAFAIVQEIYNDPSEGAHGVLYKSPVGPGFGHID